MKDLRKFIKTTIREFLNEKYNEKYNNMFDNKYDFTKHNLRNICLIGGAESNMILNFIINELSSTNILVITAATKYKKRAEKKYNKIFNSLRCNTDFIHASNNTEVDTKENLNKLKNCDTVFFVGGDQSRVSECYLNTYFLEELINRISEGINLIGTSAGAMVMSKYMIAGGDKIPKMSEGLSIIPNIIIDTHFKERNREIRLDIAVSNTSKQIGLGIPENTAILFKGDMVLIFGDGDIKVINHEWNTYT